jgi:hypothetical protein
VPESTAAAEVTDADDQLRLGLAGISLPQLAQCLTLFALECEEGTTSRAQVTIMIASQQGDGGASPLVDLGPHSG